MKRIARIMCWCTLLFNSLSFCIARAYWHYGCDDGAQLIVARPAKPGERMNYLVAGSYNQPETAYDGWLTAELTGGITYVHYDMRGCNIKLIAKQVVRDIRAHGYEAHVFGISIGDWICRYVENEIPSAKTYAINPEPDPRILRSSARFASAAGSIFLKAISIPAGWLSVVPMPFMKTAAGPTTVAHFGDQLWDIAFIKPAPHVTKNTQAVFISEDEHGKSLDEFLRNEAIREYFAGVPIIPVHTNHGNTVDTAQAFAEAWRLGKKLGYY